MTTKTFQLRFVRILLPVVIMIQTAIIGLNSNQANAKQTQIICSKIAGWLVGHVSASKYSGLKCLYRIITISPIQSKEMLNHLSLSLSHTHTHTSKSYSDIAATVDGRDLGKAQSLEGDVNSGVTSEDIRKHIVATQKYMKSEQQTGKIDPEILRICKNDDELCTFWR